MLTIFRVIPDVGRRAFRILRGLFSRRHVFRPHYSDRQFLDFLGGNSPDYKDFRASRPSTPAVDDRAIVERYFRNAGRPIFFCRPEDVRGALKRIPVDYPVWHEALVTRVQEQTTRHALVYGRREPPLGPNFPWGDIEPGPGGDKLYRKQPHRWAFAPSFALAVVNGRLTVGDLYTLLNDWAMFAKSRSNSIAFDSNLAVIQRVLALTWAWLFLASRDIDSSIDSEYIEFSLLKVIETDIRFLTSRIGNAYANNHLLGDFFIGWFVGFIWPELATADALPANCEARFLEEMERQILPDGTSFEHSTHYHEFACEMLASYVLLQRCNGRDVSSTVRSKLRRMLKFQIDVAGPAATCLGLGDATEETFIALGAPGQPGPAAWHEIYRALYDSQVPAPRAGTLNLEPAYWMLGGRLPPDISLPGKPLAVSSLTSYPNGGLYIFESVKPDARLTFRTGPTKGQPICAGHIHADLMSLYLTVEDVRVITDSGTYTYRSHPDTWPEGSPSWRRYFAGPRAHNALAIGKHDPYGDPEGDFRDASIGLHAGTRRSFDSPICQWVESELSGSGIYSGYRRGIVRSPDEYWLVYDIIPVAADEDERDLGLQFSAGARVTVRSPTHVSISVENVVLGLDLSNGLCCSKPWVGSIEPIAGWVSDQYGAIEAAPQLRMKIADGQRSTAFVMRTGTHDDEPFHVEVQVIEQGACILVERGGIQDVWLIRTVGESKPMVWEDYRFDGDLLWLRKAGSRILNLRWMCAKIFSDETQDLSICSQSITESLEIQFDGRDSRVTQFSGADVSISWVNT